MQIQPNNRPGPAPQHSEIQKQAADFESPLLTLLLAVVNHGDQRRRYITPQRLDTYKTRPTAQHLSFLCSSTAACRFFEFHGVVYVFSSLILGLGLECRPRLPFWTASVSTKFNFHILPKGETTKLSTMA